MWNWISLIVDTLATASVQSFQLCFAFNCLLLLLLLLLMLLPHQAFSGYFPQPLLSCFPQLPPPCYYRNRICQIEVEIPWPGLGWYMQINSSVKSVSLIFETYFVLTSWWKIKIIRNWVNLNSLKKYNIVCCKVSKLKSSLFSTIGFTITFHFFLFKN